MASVESITIEASDSGAADGFYAEALGVGDRVRTQPSDEQATGFGGFVLGLVLAQPDSVDHLVRRAVEAGAKALKPPAKSLWGYGGAVQAPDGTVVSIAASSKKNTGPPSPEVDDLVLQLGVADVSASKQFYIERGFSVAKSYGRKYVEFDTGPVSVTLNKRSSLAKTFGVSPEGSGSPRLVIAGDVEPFTDPDGYPWVAS